MGQDLRRNETDADLMDIDINVHEAEFALAHLHDWIKPRHEATPIVMEPGHVRVRRDPLGVTLVIGAWNEPFMLTLGTLVSAIAVGNTTVVKPSEVSEASAAVLAEMIPKFLDADAVAVVTGGVPETTALLDQHWDLKEAIHDFYGEDPKKSPDYGRIINRRSFDRLAGLISNGTVVAGGETDADEPYIAPTVLVDVPVDSQIMQEEVFGPILPRSRSTRSMRWWTGSTTGAII